MVITELRRRVDELEARLSSSSPSAGMPGSKPSSKRRQHRDKRGAQASSPRLCPARAEPTRRVIHAPESCPGCGAGMSGAWVQRTREVFESPVAPAEVLEHAFVARMCALCRKWRMSQDSLQGLAIGLRRLGPIW